jgi:myo-inositol-1-phosphate synthase
MQRPEKIKKPEGKLAILLPGLGAVATTLIAGVMLARKGLAAPVGSLTQMGTIRLGKRTDDRTPKIRDFAPLASLDDLVFGAWDLFPDNAYEAAVTAEVLEAGHLAPIRKELELIAPMEAAFYPEFVKRLQGTHVKHGATKADIVDQLRNDIRRFMWQSTASRAVCVWCGSTEIYLEAAPAHRSIAAFERGLRENDPSISSSMLYAWACLKEGVPYANGAPNLTVDIPAMLELARETETPVCGKDFKTGQTFLKTLLAPGFKARMLGMHGWFSNNILGNRDGEVLDEPGSFKSKEVSKLGALEQILQPNLYPDLYGKIHHKICIDYYPPRGDAKESWDNIDIFGWLNYPMQLKINFLCRDSILAAPIVLDVALFLDLAKRAKMHGIQEWLSFYFKSPMHAAEIYPEHDLFIQLMKLKNTLRYLKGEELITHLGREYYD